MSDFDQTAEGGIPQSVLEDAADWFLKLQENRADSALLSGFDAWRRQHPHHDAAWKRTCKAWQALDMIEPGLLRAEGAARVPSFEMRARDLSASFDHNKQTFRKGARGLRRAGAFAACALAACLVLVLAPGWLLRLEADHATATGEIRTIDLQDGSRVTLAGRSAIAEQFEGGKRQVTLLAGEAFFDVARDPERPFTVTAGGFQVKVLGTEFNLRRGQAATSVALLEGAVTAMPDLEMADKVALQPGHMLRVDRASGAASVLAVDPADIAAWRRGRLVVSGQTVASVAEQIGRYQVGWITIPDSQLASRRVTGIFDLSKPDRALRALVAPFGGQVIEISPYFHVLRGAS